MREDLVYEAWETGNLAYKLFDYQFPLWDVIQDAIQTSYDPFVVN